MKKNILVFGLISGVLCTAFMLFMANKCYTDSNFEGNKILGFGAMIIAMSFIFVGIKNYRDKYNNGFISFGGAFKIGFFISLVASTIYVGVWLIDYYLFIPDFLDKYIAHVMKECVGEGASASEIVEKSKEMTEFKEMYKNPLFVILSTYLEILPMGIGIALLSAFLLKRNQPIVD